MFRVLGIYNFDPPKKFTLESILQAVPFLAQATTFLEGLFLTYFLTPQFFTIDHKDLYKKEFHK